MLTRTEQANLNLDEARAMRAGGASYREIGRALGLTTNQLGRIRRVLKRAKASGTRLRGRDAAATDRDLPIGGCVLPPGLRHTLRAAGYRTLGDIADALADPAFAGLAALPGIGAHRARLVEGLLEHHGLLPGPDDLRAAVLALFPELESDVCDRGTA